MLSEPRQYAYEMLRAGGPSATEYCVAVHRFGGIGDGNDVRSTVAQVAFPISYRGGQSRTRGLSLVSQVQTMPSSLLKSLLSGTTIDQIPAEGELLGRPDIFLVEEHICNRQIPERQPISQPHHERKTRATPPTRNTFKAALSHAHLIDLTISTFYEQRQFCSHFVSHSLSYHFCQRANVELPGCRCHTAR